MRIGLVAAFLLGVSPAIAQTAAPAAGSSGAGPVGPSVTQPNTALGQTPPGTPSGQTVPERISRDAVGQSVIGHTATPPSSVPGNTGGVQSGTRQ